MKQAHKTLAFWLLVALIGMSVIHFRNQNISGIQDIPFSDVLASVTAHQLDEITIKDGIFTGKFKPETKNGAYFKSVGPMEVDSAF